MQILWTLNKAFVKDILEELPDPKPPYNTVSSIVRKLENEGFVDHHTYGNTHQYFPLLKKSQYRSTVFSRLLNNYFSGSPESLLSHFVKEEKMDPHELKTIIDRLKD